jgi:hypothetical protein
VTCNGFNFNQLLLKKKSDGFETIAFCLPAADIGQPFAIFSEMTPKNVHRAGGWLTWYDVQGHVGFLQPPATFVVIAGGAGRHHIRPGMHPAHMSRNNVVDRQVCNLLAAILACIIIPPKNLAPVQFDPWPGPLNHVFQADDGWARESPRHGLDCAAAVGDQRGFSGEHQPQRSSRVANINWLKVGVQNQNFHAASAIWQIILQWN